MRDEDWGDVWTVMRTLAERHGAENVRLVVWFVWFDWFDN